MDITESNLIESVYTTQDFYTGSPDSQEPDAAAAGYTSKSMMFYRAQLWAP